jgi:hypothetical protein
MSQPCSKPQAFLDACRNGGAVKTKLCKLLENIDPAHTLDRISNLVDNAINSFRLRRGVVQNREEFETILTNFFCHIENVVLGIRPQRLPHPEIDWHRCSNMLRKEYGPNGENTAFEIAKSGTEGGLYSVLKAIARHMADEYAGNCIGYYISDFWESLSAKEKVAVSKEYLDKYGYLIPSDLMEGEAVRVRAFFWKMLEEHPKIVQKLRNINRGA